MYAEIIHRGATDTHNFKLHIKHTFMKSFVATIEIKNRSFNQNNVENIWLSAKDRKDALEKARRLARWENAKFISVRLVK